MKFVNEAFVFLLQTVSLMEKNPAAKFQSKSTAFRVPIASIINHPNSDVNFKLYLMFRGADNVS